MPPQVYAIIFVLAIAGMFYGSYKNMESQNRELRAEVVDNKHTINTLEFEKKTKHIIDEANIKAGKILNEAQIVSAEKKDARVAKASASAIQKTLDERSEKYEGFIERVDAKNVDIVNCRSDYRKMRDEKACIGHVR
jgi:hypothetical protein